MSKKAKWAGIGLGVLAVVAVIVVGVSLLWKQPADEVSLTDAEKFAQEYTEVGADNVFVYRDMDEIIRILEHGTGVVYLGFPECPWCQRYVKYLNEVAKDFGVEKIYYYNIREDRNNNSEGYQKVIELLGDMVEYDEEGRPKIYVPEVIYVKEGEIVAHDNETSMESGDVDEYWTQEKVTTLKKRTLQYMQDAEVTTCNSGCNL